MSYVVYVRPTERTFRDRLKAILGPRLWPHGLALFSYVAYILFVQIYLVLLKPYTIVNLVNVAGMIVPSPAFGTEFLFLLFLVLIVFMAYPSYQLLLAASKVMNRSVTGTLTQSS